MPENGFVLLVGGNVNGEGIWNDDCELFIVGRVITGGVGILIEVGT